MSRSPVSLKVLLLSAEVVPFAKTGGLADVAASLPKALRAIGHDVRICMPRYRPISIGRFGLRPVLTEVQVPLDMRTETVGLFEVDSGGVPVYFVDSDRYFGSRDSIYGYEDDGDRFVLFCRAALEVCRQLDWQPDIVHCNDWHTGLVPNWMRTIYLKDDFFRQTASVFTIHNVAYQGVFGYRILEVAGIAPQGFVYPQISELAERVDFMGRGILFADMVTTVSERYAKEILTPEFGEKLDPVLRDRRNHLVGILNGIDVEELDPAADPYLEHPFDSANLEGKQQQKEILQELAGLPVEPITPIIGIISRLSDQKGFDILSYQIEPMMRLGIQLVLLGTGDEKYHELCTSLAKRFDNLAVFLTFDTPLARKIYAGSDMFLMPSFFEPCGLGQMIAMRYGSIPIVRATGGLADTVVDYDPSTNTGDGFVFEQYDCWELYAAVVRAREAYRNDKVWAGLIQRAMAKDFSWDKSAARYAATYDLALRYRRKF
jgi:starch synthase